MTLRIGHITYANCTPLFTTLAESGSAADYTFVEGAPASLNVKLRSGDIDVCPSSSIEYALNPERYMILPDLSISAVGAVKSVLLFSRAPLEDLRGCEIGLTMESDTSVRLLQVIMNGFYRLGATFTRFPGSFDEGLAKFPALLLIGDAALRRSAETEGIRIYDLGEEWLRHTGLPFVFALWLVRRQAVADCPDAMSRLHRSLVRAKITACANYDAIAEQAPERAWLSHDLLAEYWRTISYDLTPAHIEGLFLFYRHCADMDLIDVVPEAAFFDGT